MNPKGDFERAEKAAKEIVDAAIKVHRALGPGLLESAYQACLAYELCQRGLKVDTEVPIPVVYEKHRIDVGFRIDMLVEDCVIVENKAVEQIMPIHEAQILTYLRLTGLQLGFLLNWNVVLMRQGIRRMLNDVESPKYTGRQG